MFGCEKDIQSTVGWGLCDADADGTDDGETPCHRSVVPGTYHDEARLGV